MKKNDLLRHGNEIIRVLEIKDDDVLYVPCLRQSMPKWGKQMDFSAFESCTEDELCQATHTTIPNIDDLSSADVRIMHERYTMIAAVLSFIGDERRRSEAISMTAEEQHISKQTVRNYLRVYLVYNDIAALVPMKKQEDRPLTNDEKIMRRALNKYFYTRNRNSLPTAYMMMLKESYCDAEGNLLPCHPTINQFCYFYRRHRKMETFYISRDGMKDYQRNNRPLLGDGVQEYASAVGVGMMDATVCDIYLVNDAGNLVGRPILTACIDAYSGLCCGYSLSWEGGVYSIRNLLANVITDKVCYANQFGISISRDDWNCDMLPGVLVTDMGNEYTSFTFEQIAELGVKVVNLPSYRPELKGVVEKFFDIVQGSYKKHLHGKGVIEPDYQERGAHDYRKDACLTMYDFERVLLHCIIHYNSKRMIDDFPFSAEMIAQKVSPNSSAIWNWGVSKMGANLIAVDYDALILTLLPRITGKFTRRGLVANKLRYKHDAYTERYLQGGTATVAYNPDDSSTVWLIDGGEYVRFDLIESRYSGMELVRVHEMKAKQREIESASAEFTLQAQIDLARHIETIANNAVRHRNTNIKGILNTRRKEQNRSHVDFMKGGNGNER